MHLFVFQNREQRWKQVTRQPNSTRGEFDLKLLRLGVGNSKLWGYGTHELAAMCHNMEMKDLLNGHVLAIESASKAVWVKLNHEQLVRGSTRMVACYSDMSMADFADEYNECLIDAPKLSSLNFDRARIKQSISHLNALAGQALRSRNYSANTITSIDQTIKELLDNQRDIDRLITVYSEKRTAFRKRVYDYFEDHLTWKEPEKK